MAIHIYRWIEDSHPKFAVPFAMGYCTSFCLSQVGLMPANGSRNYPFCDSYIYLDYLHSPLIGKVPDTAPAIGVWDI